jgi:hypothetical protein
MAELSSLSILAHVSNVSNPTGLAPSTSRCPGTLANLEKISEKMAWKLGEKIKPMEKSMGSERN